ncbi:TIGR04222 domain-containing membrane protein [Streptomyces sp. NPDC059524]|uniref:TIGR04222 domain-containing membrane protein n=1 Tax=Streptomyces sp. NPDC059524 TaxID=3346856 RepID=UPI0036850FDD
MFWVLFLVLAGGLALVTCGRLCLAAVRAADAERAAGDGEGPHERVLSLYETAFLSGGPRRVADVALVSMARSRRLLLAHTGWATVVDPVGGDDMERSVIGAIGPQGQSRIAPVRSATASGDAVRTLTERLVAAGLATPDTTRTTVASGVAQVKAAAAAIVVLAAVATLMPGQEPPRNMPVALWFLLPLLLTLCCLFVARFEIHPYTHWASPTGQRLLSALPDGTGSLLAVALRGVPAVDDPALRSAFAHPARDPLDPEDRL